MHFVLWGSLQLNSYFAVIAFVGFNALRALGFSSTVAGKEVSFLPQSFNALRALGFSSTRSVVPRAITLLCFNALRALGFSSTTPQEVEAQMKKFQCTSCFGVLFNCPSSLRSVGCTSFNALRALGFSSTNCSDPLGGRSESFNALRALGFSSTHGGGVGGISSNVSMHFVLWGSLQPVIIVSIITAVMFQCTSCFGVLFNWKAPALLAGCVSFNALRALGFSSTFLKMTQQLCRMVSMHFVLWGSLQPRSPAPFLRVALSFNALRALGFSST